MKMQTTSPKSSAAKKMTKKAFAKSGESLPEIPSKPIQPIDETQVAGWREWVGLPQLGIKRIKAKLDTGARSSALHAFNVRPLQRAGVSLVQFDVHPLQRNDQVCRTCVAEAVDYRWIMNSGGNREKRFVILTTLQMGNEIWPIEVTLADRDQMGFRMLIGRTAMEHRLIIDPTTSYRVGKPAKVRSADGSRSVSLSEPIADEEE